MNTKFTIYQHLFVLFSANEISKVCIQPVNRPELKLNRDVYNVQRDLDFSRKMSYSSGLSLFLSPGSILTNSLFDALMIPA